MAEINISKKQRISDLKKLIKIANGYILEYENIRKSGGQKWINAKAEISIHELKGIIKKIKRDLHPERVDDFCKPYPKTAKQTISQFEENQDRPENKRETEHFNQILGQTSIQFALFNISRFAPKNNIIDDFMWSSDGSISDYIDIASGKKRIKDFEELLPDKIKIVERDVLPFLIKIGIKKDVVKAIKQAAVQSKKNAYLLSNLLLITSSENITRELCLYVYKNQNISISHGDAETHIYNGFNSLEALISKGKWENDYPINLFEAIVYYNDVNEKTINEWKRKHEDSVKAVEKSIEVLKKFTEDLGDVKEPNESQSESIQKYVQQIKDLQDKILHEKDYNEVKINIKVVLNFIIRKYKDDRNSLLHGYFDRLDHRWKNYVNYCALINIYIAYKKYISIYNN